MGLPSPVRVMADAPVPLVLVTGFTGAGKSALVAYLGRVLPEEPPWLIFSNHDLAKTLPDTAFDGITDRKLSRKLQRSPAGCLHCIGLLPTQVALTRALRALRPAVPQGIILEAAADGHGEAALAALRRPPLGLITRLVEVVAVLRPIWLEKSTPRSVEALQALCTQADVIIANDWNATPAALQERCRNYAETLEKRFFTANFGESDYSPSKRYKA